MRCAIISDVQGNMAALEAVWADIGAHSVDTVFCAGDLTGYGVKSNQVIDFIQSVGIVSVMGDFDEIVGFDLSARDHYHPDGHLEATGIEALRWNREKVGLSQKRYLRSLPLQLRDQIGGLRLLLVHGSPRSINEYLFEERPEATFAQLTKFAGSDLIIFGHTGQAYAKELAGTWFLNAGSVGGFPGAAGQANYWLAELSVRPRFELRTVSYPASMGEESFSYLAAADQSSLGVKSGQPPMAVETTSIAQLKGEV